MIRSTALRHLAAYSVSLPTLAVPAKVAKETVYMPSAIAARVLGNAREAKTGGEAKQPDDERASA